jgi:hypothetical protein
MNPYRALFELLPAEVRSHGGNVVTLIFSWALGLSLEWANQWQQEIINIQAWNHDLCYYFPFFIAGCVNLWVARDLWDWIGWAGFFIVGLGSVIAVWFWD